MNRLALIIITIFILLYLICVNSFESYDYIVGLTSDHSKIVVDHIKTLINTIIQANKNTPINTNALCPGSTLETIRLHTSECNGPAYVKSGGCQFEIPGIGCGCYEQAEAGLTRITGLDTLQVDHFGNLHTNINYATKRVAIVFDLVCSANIKVYGTAKATFPACVKYMLGPSDDYLIEARPIITLSDCVIRGTFKDDGSLELESSTFEIGEASLVLKRTDWFANVPAGVREVLNVALGSVGDLWWDLISKYIVSDYIDIRSIINSAVKNSNFAFSVPYAGLVVPVGYIVSNLSLGVLSIGDWKIGESENKLCFSSAGVNVGYDKSMKMVEGSALPTVYTGLPPMIRIGGWILFAPPKGNSRMVLYKPGSKQSFVLSSQEGWKPSSETISDRMISIFDSGLDYSCLQIGSYKMIQPALIPTSLIVYRSSNKYSNSNVLIFSYTKLGASVEVKKWLDLDWDQQELEASSKCAKPLAWVPNEWCSAVGAHMPQTLYNGVGVTGQVGGNVYYSPSDRPEFAKRYSQRWGDYSCQSIVRYQTCSDLASKYPNLLKMGEGMTSQEVFNQVGIDVERKWTWAGCNDWRLKQSQAVKPVIIGEFNPTSYDCGVLNKKYDLDALKRAKRYDKTLIGISLNDYMRKVPGYNKDDVKVVLDKCL